MIKDIPLKYKILCDRNDGRATLQNVLEFCIQLFSLRINKWNLCVVGNICCSNMACYLNKVFCISAIWLIVHRHHSAGKTILDCCADITFFESHNM